MTKCIFQFTDTEPGQVENRKNNTQLRVNKNTTISLADKTCFQNES